MPIFLLLLLTVVCLLERFPEPKAVGGWKPDLAACAALTWGATGVAIAAAWLLSRWLRRGLRRRPELRDDLVYRYGTLRFYHLVLLVGLYAGSLYFFGWGWAVGEMCERVWPSASPVGWSAPDDPLFPVSGLADAAGIARPATAVRPALVPGAELLLLAPFLAGLLLSWACFYDADRALHDCESFWSRAAYVWHRTRQNLAFLFAPLALMIAEKALQHSAVGAASEEAAFVAAVALVPAVFVAFPWVLRLVLGLKPLPEGPLRERLMAASRRLKFRCSDILTWNTRGGVANAVVAGVLPAPRYVLFTDRLLSELSPDEVEAVFGHEVGHIKHHHITYYVGFMLASMCAVACLWKLATDYVPAVRSLLPPTEDWTKVPFVGVVGAYIFLVFGFLSRRCERQADVFGCRAVSCRRPACEGHGEDASLEPGGRALCATGIRTFIGALEKVDRINHGPTRHRPGLLSSWQHSTVAHRVAFLERLLAEPALERRFQRRVGQVKWGLALALGVLLAVLLSIQGWQAVLSF